ncbi:MAG: hypothetical protein ACNS63_00590 [Candidatus Nitrospinota bacterium M3_3B_026]
MSMVFDTLAYAKELKEAGVPEAQAEVQARALVRFAEEQVATKGDLKNLETALRSDMGALRGEMKELEHRLRTELRDTENRLIKWMVGLTLGQFAIMIAGFGLVISMIR